MHRFSMDQQITPNYNKSDPPQHLKSLPEEKKLIAAEMRGVDQPGPPQPSDETQTSEGRSYRGCLGAEASG